MVPVELLVVVIASLRARNIDGSSATRRAIKDDGPPQSSGSAYRPEAPPEYTPIKVDM
jgi:hypothetical protein